MDRETAGIPGMLPVVLDLPIRFTQEPARGDQLNGVFTNARGWIRGWNLPDDETERVANDTSAELVLQKRPLQLHIELASANNNLPLVNGKRIYILRRHCKS